MKLYRHRINRLEDLSTLAPGVGLELDEYPFIAKGQTMELAEGMVLALEPKIVTPGKGVVGIENTHLVTRNGLEKLCTFPDTVSVL